MHRAFMSLSIGDSDKPIFSSFIPQPIQRLSISPSSASTIPNKQHTPPSPSFSSNHTSFKASPTVALSRPHKSPSFTRSNSSLLPRSSTSISDIFPYLRPLEISDEMPSPREQKPLLVLKLSSSSFLDSIATDPIENTPLYSVETVASSTTIWRSDPWNASVKIADIYWPKDIPLKGKARDTHGALIQMGDARRKDTLHYLKFSSIGSYRKFNIPNHPHILKWKRTGHTYQCTTSSCKGPVATLDISKDDEPPQLNVFETLGPLHHSVPQLEHAGISISLLDNLFVTALLLVTDPEDWMTLSHHPNSILAPPTDNISVLRFSSAPASTRQWRKIMYGEPLYPSLRTPSIDTRCDEGTGILDISEPTPLPTSMNQWRKIVYGEPLFPSLRPRSADGLDLPAHTNTAWDGASVSSESACPATPSSAPSFYTSSFFDDSERTVTRIDTNNQYSAPRRCSPAPISPIQPFDCMPSSSRRSPSPRSTSIRRELPAPPSSWHPPPESQPWLPRSRSSPPLSCTLPTIGDHAQCVTEDGLLVPSIASGSDVGLEDTPPSRNRALSSGSVVRRRLPAVPSSPVSLVNPPFPPTRRPTIGRTLPPTPGSTPRSNSSRNQYPRTSPDISPTALFNTMPTQPSTSQQPRRHRPEKAADEVLGWVRSVTRAHHRRAFDCDEENHPGDSEEAPPAYNLIDFSEPQQQHAPPNPS